MIESLTGAWPWYVSGPLLGLMVPILLFAGNKHFGVSSSLRHICAASIKPKAEYFRYDWKKSSWNLVFVAGTIIGAVIAVTVLEADTSPALSESAREMFASWGMASVERLQPPEIFAVGGDNLLRPLVALGLGGFLVGFGARYAGGCTSGHALMGTSLLNLGSYVAVLAFLVGGFVVSNLIVPSVMAL
ncbi:MAG: YeeE/YedE family protein [Spirochaetaceae bacterium]